MNSFRKRRTKKGSGTWTAISIVAVPTIILGMGFVWLQFSQSSIEARPDLCLKNKELEAHSVLVIDRTDVDENPGQLSRLLSRIKNDLAPFEKFSIYVIDENHSQLPVPIFSLCNPGTGDDANILVRSPKAAQEKFDKEFSRPIEKLIRASNPTKSAVKSPIIETLQLIPSIESFASTDMHRRIYIFSDMLQNTRYSHYSKSLDYTQFAKRYPDLARVDLQNVTVVISYVRRRTAQNIQGPKHIQFWQDYFRHAGARRAGIDG